GGGRMDLDPAVFHDHDWEPAILKGALATPGFYIGSQGSQRAAATRRVALAELGVPEDRIARLHGPVGLIRSARDARVLAVSVLAEVLDVAKVGSGR
ncbi:XdhC family protein, partial [Glutamicibacter soli]